MWRKVEWNDDLDAVLKAGWKKMPHTELARLCKVSGTSLMRRAYALGLADVPDWAVARISARPQGKRAPEAARRGGAAAREENMRRTAEEKANPWPVPSKAEFRRLFGKWFDNVSVAERQARGDGIRVLINPRYRPAPLSSGMGCAAAMCTE